MTDLVKRLEEIGCIDPEGGCDLCMRRCEVCNHPKDHSNE